MRNNSEHYYEEYWYTYINDRCQVNLLFTVAQWSYFWNYVDILESSENSNYMYNMDFSRVLFFFKVQYQTKIYCSRIKRS